MILETKKKQTSKLLPGIFNCTDYKLEQSFVSYALFQYWSFPKREKKSPPTKITPRSSESSVLPSLHQTKAHLIITLYLPIFFLFFCYLKTKLCKKSQQSNLLPVLPPESLSAATRHCVKQNKNPSNSVIAPLYS